MGLWGAAQALAFGAGGLAGTAASDLARHVFGSPATAYAAVFGMEAVLFLVAAALAMGVFQTRDDRRAQRPAIRAGAVQAG
jgi:BCD family chlorophyll transporter-like MFS transporter